MIVFPNAKINIGLKIISKRSDGFHNIETIFLPIKLADILEIKETTNSTTQAELVISGNKIDGDLATNLVLKAYYLLKKDYDLPPVKILLHKHIPIGAGLGGGSSDGAFTLLTLNKQFTLNIPTNTLLNYASQLGSDCPFFLINRPVLATEKGNKFENIIFNPSGFTLVLIHPPIFINTTWAYSQIKPSINQSQSLKELIKLPITEWKNKITNDFEEPLFAKHPTLLEIKQKLYSLGAVYASMTGSGSAIYGFFNEVIKIKKQFSDYFVWQQTL